MSATPPTIRRPGSKGGKFWIDEHGRVRYGTRPQDSAPPQYPPVLDAPEAGPPAAAGMGQHPEHQEFGRWAPDATTVYLRQALKFAPCLTNVIDRYLDMVSRYGLGAAAEAMKLVAPEDVPNATAALGRIRRLARWDRYGRVTGEGTGTPLPDGRDPGNQSTSSNPFVRAAMNAGMPQDAALLWQQLALRAMNRQHSGGTDLAEVLMKHQPAQARWLMKAVMQPGSRGGHVYWKNGRLHYGIPAPPAKRRRRGGNTGQGNAPAGPSALAVALMKRGHRILYTDHSGTRTWGEVITATGDILAVIPDGARHYDLLHTVCVPVQSVIRVKPDTDEQGQGEILEKSDGEPEIGRHPLDSQPDDGEAEDGDPYEAFFTPE